MIPERSAECNDSQHSEDLNCQEWQTVGRQSHPGEFPDYIWCCYQGLV